MLRVAIVIGKMDSGGKKNLVMEYYRHLDRNQIQFDFICDLDSQAIPKEEIELLGGYVYLVRPYENIIGNLIDIYKICKKNRYVIMHTFNSTMNIFPLLMGYWAGVPIRISESLSMAHHKEKKTIIKNILRLFSSCFATHYMACGKACGEWQFGKRKMELGKVAVFKTVIDAQKNEFDLIKRNETREKYYLNDKIVFGHIGRFVPQKNTLFLLDIFNEIYKINRNAILLLIGDGNLKTEIFNKIKEMRLEKQVLYLGSREDIIPFYNAMDVFLLPSLYEGLPVVGLEAQCCGLPVFFSSEVTKEAKVCELARFINLKRSPKEWAEEIIQTVTNNASVRRGYSKEIADTGFDSYHEAARLQKYYIDAAVNCGGYKGDGDVYVGIR